MSVSSVVLVIGITIVGACVQGAIGFGLGLVGAPLLALIDTDFVPGPIIAIGVPLTAGIIVRERRALDVRTMRWALSGRLVGTIAAVTTMLIVAEQALNVLFGVLVLIAVGLSVAGWHLAPSVPTLFIAGTASGFMGTSSGIGGPPIALVYQRGRGEELRATVGLVLAFGSILSLLSLIVVGRYGGTELALTALLAPGTAIGFAVSGRTRHLLDRGWVRPAVLAVAAASAIALLIRESF